MDGMPLQTRWHWLKLGQGSSAGNAAQMRLDQCFWDPTCCISLFRWVWLWLFFVKFWWEWKSRLFWILGGLPCRHMNDQRAWPNTWNHSSKRSLCSFWLWSFILYALNSLHPDGGQLQPVFWFMPSNLNPFNCLCLPTASVLSSASLTICLPHTFIEPGGLKGFIWPDHHTIPHMYIYIHTYKYVGVF